MSTNEHTPYELFGRVVAAHIEIPRQVMRRYKEIPTNQSISEFLSNLRQELRQGSMARTRFVRENRAAIDAHVRSATAGAPRMMMERAMLLLELSRRESLGMVRMSNVMRNIRMKIAPIELDFQRVWPMLPEHGGVTTDQAVRLHSLADQLALTASQIERDFYRDSSQGSDKDPYKGTSRLTDFLDLSEHTLASVMPDLNRVAVDDQVSRFIQGVLNPRIEKMRADIAAVLPSGA